MTSRRDEIAAAVAAYDAANPLTPLPRDAARLLGAMFPNSDVCRRRPETLAARGFTRSALPGTLLRLMFAGFLSKERGISRGSNIFRLHLPPLVRQ
jgi:hypothetical protein